MPWVMSTLHTPPKKRIDGSNSSYHVYIGAVKIAEIYFSPTATKWKVILRLMRNDVSYDTSRQFETMGDALKELHVLLNAPPPEGARAGASHRPPTRLTRRELERAAQRGTPVDLESYPHPVHRERPEDWSGTGQPVPYKDPHWGNE